MKFEEKLKEYASIAVRYGVNVQKGQFVTVFSPIIAADFAIMVQEAAYEAGAKDVDVVFTDSRVTKNRFMYTDTEVIADIPEWSVLRRTVPAREGGAIINIIAEDPEALKGVPGEKMIALSKATRKAYKEYYELMDKSYIPWTIVAYPCEKWATKVFPDVSPAKAEEKLMQAILKSVRIGRGDAGKKWKSHDRNLKRRAKRLNKYAFSALRFENSLGTELTVGLVKKHIWLGGASTSRAGNDFFPNMPTEEIFTMPDKDRVNGRVVASMPLSYRGSLCKGFSIDFKDGCAVSWSAEQGSDVLDNIFGTDEGAKRLGEVALIPHSSPISDMGILFYNTLFDENASCHLALGDCYPDTVKGGEEMSREELSKLGGNESAVHVDFMFGTSDMKVTGITENGEEIPVFENGNFVF